MNVLDPLTGLIRTIAKLSRGGEAHRDEPPGLPPVPDREPGVDVGREEPADEGHVELLSVVLAGIITDYEYEKLDGLSEPGPFMVEWRDTMREELKHLEALGYVTVASPGGIEHIAPEQGGGSREFDLKHYVQVTGRGRQYLSLRKRYDRVGEPGE